MFTAVDLPPEALVLLGDSHIANGNWDEMLGHSVVNRGIGGDTIELVETRVSALGRGEPCTIVLMVGINDLLRGRSPSDTVRSYTRLLAEIKRTHPGARVVVHGLFLVNTSLLPDSVQNADIKETNSRLERLARRSRSTFVGPLPELLDANGELDRIFTFDGLHLNGAGYQKWAAALRSLVPCTIPGTP